MGILLTLLVLGVLLILVVRAWRGYAAELRRYPQTQPQDGSSDLFPSLFEGDASQSIDGHSAHHTGPSCGDTHHGGCDFGIGHFDGGHGGFDGGGHH